MRFVKNLLSALPALRGMDRSRKEKAFDDGYLSGYHAGFEDGFHCLAEDLAELHEILTSKKKEPTQ